MDTNSEWPQCYGGAAMLDRRPSMQCSESNFILYGLLDFWVAGLPGSQAPGLWTLGSGLWAPGLLDFVDANMSPAGYGSR